MPIGIMGGMCEEVDALLPLIENAIVHERASRRFVQGTLNGHGVVVVFSRWGKVAAASTATELIIEHDVDRVVFSGVAGSLREDVGLGDVVVAERLIQHDFDAWPFFPPRVIPLLEAEFIPTDSALSTQLAAASTTFLKQDSRSIWERLSSAPSQSPSIHRGDIATGDQFISSSSLRDAVIKRVPSALCVEMEGAAAAQVCFEHSVPFACVRTISDAADHSAERHFLSFITGLASAYTAGIVQHWLGGQ